MREMSKKSEALYESVQNDIERNNGQGSSVFKSMDSTGGKLPPRGPRRAIFPTVALRPEYVHDRVRYPVSKIEAQNYRAICCLANSKWQTDNAVDIGGVKCTYWSLGESLKPGGVVNTFVIAVFCYHLYSKPNGHPDTSKIHYYFPNISDNLMKDVDDARQDVLARSFRRSKKTRPLDKSNILFFPIFFQHHWFVFTVDIKDRKFVFLDPYYNKDDEYQEFVRDRLKTSF